jgi:HAD superfamily hydrolase (TIGR01490 family)
MLAFCRHVRGTPRFVAGMLWLSPMLVAMKLGIVANDRAKVFFLRHFLGGRTRDDLAAHASTFADVVEGWLRPGALERVRWHQQQGHEVRIVSASLDVWLLPWAARHGIGVLCTRARWDGDRFTGDLDGKNCNGEEKVARIRADVPLEGFDDIYAYGDTSGDQPMLAVASHPSFRPFHP